MLGSSVPSHGNPPLCMGGTIAEEYIEEMGICEHPHLGKLDASLRAVGVSCRLLLERSKPTCRKGVHPLASGSAATPLFVQHAFRERRSRGMWSDSDDHHGMDERCTFASVQESMASEHLKSEPALRLRAFGAHHAITHEHTQARQHRHGRASRCVTAARAASGPRASGARPSARQTRIAKRRARAGPPRCASGPPPRRLHVLRR